ncbi:MAG: methyltransferase domain-containing protein [Knoellia sp.]
MFGPRFAKHVAARYRKRGLDGTAQRMVDWLVAQGIEGATVLEIGGGVGEIGLELLRHGASHATNLELSPAYDIEASHLIAEAGLVDRVDRRLGDIAAEGAVAESADIVVMHRVICCYPDADRLLGAAADHADRFIVLSHPPRNVLSRSLLFVENLTLRVRRREYRTFAHPPEQLREILGGHGFSTDDVHSGLIWQVLGARTPALRA